MVTPPELAEETVGAEWQYYQVSMELGEGLSSNLFFQVILRSDWLCNSGILWAVNGTVHSVSSAATSAPCQCIIFIEK
jgi:hypothetical protein